MTSSAASETDRARNLVSDGSTWRKTSTPPPPGRCTSRSTTSGPVALITSIAASTSPASPTISTAAPSSAFTPLRNIWWSSTSTTRVISILVSFGFTPHFQPDLGALAGSRANFGLSPVALHSPNNGLAQAHPILRDRVEVAALAPVPYEDRDLVAGDLRVDREGRRTPLVPRFPVGVLRGVDHGLAGGLEHRAEAVVQRAVADADDLDGQAVVVLDLGGGLAHGGGEILLGVGLRLVQPGPQVGFLGAGQPLHLARGVRAALDQGERVQDGVVYVRRDLGAIQRAEPQAALGVQVTPEPQQPRGN